MTKMTLSYRYPGLQPFETKDAGLFYGRDRETRALYAQVMVEKMVVLFSKSGMGKSSLLNAGLTPLLDKTNILPLRIRLSNTASALKEQFLQELGRDEFHENVTLDPALRSSNATLWEQVKAATFTKNGATAVPLFILDQFEEIFTLYTPDLRQQFIRELADLTNGTPPEPYLVRLRARIEAGEKFDVPLLESSPRCKFIFSIRSDLLHLLNALSPVIPDIMRSRFELLPFGREQAEEAITLPAMIRDPKHTFASRPFHYDEASLDTLINYLSKNGAEDVESFQLQILCQYIERLIISGNKSAGSSPGNASSKTTVVTPGLFGGEEGLKTILRNFYTDQIGALPAEKQLIAREIIEEQLITESERRRSVAEDDLLHFHADKSLLDQLVEMRLLRKEPRLKTFYYEISHDTLVPPILVKYKERRREEERVEELERRKKEQAERDAQLALERKKRMRAIRFTAFSLTLAVISIAAMIYALRLKNKAERDRRHAYANDIAYKSQIALRDGDRTAAFRLAEFAQRYVEADNSNVVHAIVEALYYNDNPDSTKRGLWNYNLEGHEAAVLSVAFSPDGKLLATGSDDNSARIWDVAAGKTILKIPCDSSPVLSVAFSPDGKTIATAGASDKTAKIWDLTSGKLQSAFEGHSDQVLSVAFSPDGKYLATGSKDNTARIWDVTDAAKPVLTLPHPTSFVYGLAFSPDGKFLATGSSDNLARIWDVASGKFLMAFRGHRSPVRSVAFSPDGKTLATGSSDNTARIWEVASGKRIKTFEGHRSYVYSVAFSPDGKYLATGSEDHTARIWDVTGYQTVLTLYGHNSYIWSVAFSPDGKKIATGSDDNTTKIWDLASNEEAVMLEGNGSPLKALAFSPDGKRIVTSVEDNTLKIWDLAGGKEMKSLSGDSTIVRCVAFSSDGKNLAAACSNNKIQVWDLENAKVDKTLEGDTSSVLSIAFSPDGKRLATGTDANKVRIWDIGSRKVVKTIGVGSLVTSVVFSPDGKRLATGADDNNVKIWDISDNRKEIMLPEKTLKGHNSEIISAAFSPDGERLATGAYDGAVKIWDWKNSRSVATLAGHIEPVNSVAFSPDGKKLATGSDDHSAKIWDLQSGKSIMTLTGHTESVTGVAFSPDGKKLATAAYEGTAKIWEIDAETIISKLHEQRKLSTLIYPQLLSWNLQDILGMQEDNEEKLCDTKEAWQIAAFADLYAKYSTTGVEADAGSPGYARASRLYKCAVACGGDSTLLQRLRMPE